VALLFHQQNLRMLALLKANEGKRLLFETLASAGLPSSAVRPQNFAMRSKVCPMKSTTWR